MPTSIILHNIVISDPEKAEALANALEASSQNPKCKPSEPAIPILTDVEAVREFFCTGRVLVKKYTEIKIRKIY